MRRGILVPAIFGAVGVAILLTLGMWQLQRLAWKNTLIAQAEAALLAPPVALSGAQAAADMQGRRVTARGVFDHSAEMHVLTTRKPNGPGYLIVTPFDLASGGRILVDRGYAPEALKAPTARAAGQVEGPVEISGVLAQPNETGGFTPEPDLGRNIWFARDLPRMAAAAGAEDTLLVADAAAPGGWPKGTDPAPAYTNDHLEYAITWFSLAAIWAAMTVIFLLRQRRAA